MFKNLQFFSELDDREMVTALKAVLMKKKSLVLLLPNTPRLRLVPVESDTNWESRMGDILESLKVSTEGYSDLEGSTVGKLILSYCEWLYESEGLSKLLKPYIPQTGLFWVCNETAVSVEAISKLQGESVFNFDQHLVKFLIDEKGTKVEALKIDSYYNKTKTKSASLLSGCTVSVKSLGVADPIPNLTTQEYPINTPEYAAMIDVFEEFWSSGKDGGKKDRIVDWIIKKYKFSKKTAEVIDTICRPKSRRKGGNVKVKRINP